MPLRLCTACLQRGAAQQARQASFVMREDPGPHAMMWYACDEHAAEQLASGEAYEAMALAEWLAHCMQQWEADASMRALRGMSEVLGTGAERRT